LKGVECGHAIGIDSVIGIPVELNPGAAGLDPATNALVVISTRGGEREVVSTYDV